MSKKAPKYARKGSPQITVRLPAPLLEAVERASQQHKVPAAIVIRRALSDYLKVPLPPPPPSERDIGPNVFD